MLGLNTYEGNTSDWCLLLNSLCCKFPDCWDWSWHCMTTAKTGKSKSLFVKGRCLHLKIIIVVQLSVSYKSNCVLKRSITFLKNGGILRKSCGIFAATHSIQTFKNPQRTQNTLYTVFLRILVVKISAS